MTALATDNFNRADAANLGANWTVGPGGAQTLGVTSNQCAVKASGADSRNYYSGIAWPNDQYSQAAALQAVDYSAVDTRQSAAANSFYGAAVFSAFGPATNIELAKVVTGSYTSLTSGTAAVALNDVIRCEAQGTTVRFLVNGVQKLTTTDAALSSGNAGLMGTTSAGAEPTWEDWEGGDFSAGGAAVAHRRGLLGVGS